MPGVIAPGRDCPLCPRLAAFRAEARTAHRGWHNAPVPSFGAAEARLLVVGLAPGMQGANRTGRPFTGDHAGVLLYQTLLAHGFARGHYGADPADGLELVETRICNAVRCVPPANKPTGGEIGACNPFLAAEISAMPNLIAILALGRIAHEAVLRALGLRRAAHHFAHGAVHALPGGRVLADSYHVSRYNTSTRRLTVPMFEAVIAGLQARCAAPRR